MNDFKIGDEVVCVDSDAYVSITKGNTYSVLDVCTTEIYIKNSNGSKVCYPKKLFTKVEQMNKDNWKPKVGEKCIFKDVDEYEVMPIFVGEDWVVFKSDNEDERVSMIDFFRPLKTPAEIEQDRIIDKALNTRFVWNYLASTGFIIQGGDK